MKTNFWQKSIEWSTAQPNVRTWPPETTVMVAVDIKQGEKGAVNIYETPRDKYVGGIGEKDKARIVMVRWNSNWWYYYIGSVRIAYIKGET